MEAQACGTYAICYKTGGAKETVPECQTVEQGDLQGVLKMISKYEGKKASIQPFYDKNISFEEYIELYEEIW